MKLSQNLPTVNPLDIYPKWILRAKCFGFLVETGSQRQKNHKGIQEYILIINAKIC